jgi:AraC-like DNA-binding protein
MAQSPTRILEHELELAPGRSVHVIRRPPSQLAGLLARRYLGFRQEGAGSERWLEPPQPAVTLIVSLEGQLHAGGRLLPDAWIGGLSDTPDVVEFGGTYACIDLKLTPLGAYRLLGSPVNELARTVRALDDLLGDDGRRLGERLRAAPDWESAFNVLEAFLLARAAAGPQPDPAIAWAWSRLRETSGRQRVEALAAELGCSRRHLTAKFHEQVGLPPKTLARLLRFERVRRLLEADPVRWADIAYDCGFCDQSHLNREFRDLAGTTPGGFIARRPPGGALTGDEVTFVQDGDGVVG